MPLCPPPASFSPSVLQRLDDLCRRRLGSPPLRGHRERHGASYSPSSSSSPADAAAADAAAALGRLERGALQLADRSGGAPVRLVHRREARLEGGELPLQHLAAGGLGQPQRLQVPGGVLQRRKAGEDVDGRREGRGCSGL